MGEQVSLRSMLKGNVLVLTVSRVLWSMSDSVVMPYLSLYILSFGGSKNTIGDIFFWGGMAACILYPIGGYIADKAGRAKLVGVATLLYVTSFIIFAVAPSWEWVAIAYAYQQIVLFYMPALNAIMADSVPSGGRGRIYAMTMAIPEGVRILTPYLGGWLIGMYTLQPAVRIGYTFSLLIGFVVTYIRWRYLKETMVDRQPIGRDVVKILREGYGNVFTSLAWIFKNIRGYAIVACLLTLVGNLIAPFWVVYATEIIMLTPYEWGTVLLIGGVTKTLISIFVGNIVDKIGSRKCMLISYALSIPAMALFTLARDMYAVIPVYVVLVIGSSFMWISSSVFLANNIPRESRGRIMSALGSGMSIGVSGGGYASGFLLFIFMGVGSKLGGLIYTFNPVYPWYIQTTFLGVATVLTFLFIKDPEKAQ